MEIVGIDLGKEVVVGADPEFELVLIDKVIRANARFSSKTAKIGCDGSASQLELRPRANKDVWKVVEDVGKLMYKIKDRLPESQLLVSGNTYAIGAHIHFSFSDGTSITPNIGVVKLLDDFIGKRVLRFSGEARGGYKRLGCSWGEMTSGVEWRKKHGGFEYRTPPAMIFYHPQLTYLVMKIGKSLVEKFYNGGKFNYDPYKVVSFDLYQRFCGLSQKELWLWAGFLKHLSKLMKREPKIPVVFNDWTSWVKPKKVTSPATPSQTVKNIQISFSDEWSSIIRADFRTLLRREFRGTEDVILQLYGLSSTRGLASTIAISGFELIQLPLGGIGLPYDFRTKVDVYNLHKRNVLEGIKRNWIERRTVICA